MLPRFIPDLTLLLTEEVFEDRRDRRLNTASTLGMMKPVLIFFLFANLHQNCLFQEPPPSHVEKLEITCL
jgi:hypothetical protein